MPLFVRVLFAALLLSSPLGAQDRPVVVELYTSQGCSSCPPADALLHELAARKDVLALALHVDYWDYIGWKDIFADAAHVKRQRGYARAGGRRMIYTPQMIINGQDHVVGNRPKDVAALIQRHAAIPRPVSITLKRSGDQLLITAQAAALITAPLLVQLIRYHPESTVEITRGENADRTISYSNVVTGWRELARWDSAAPLSISAEVKGDDPIAVIVQQDGFGAIEGAAVLP